MGYRIILQTRYLAEIERRYLGGASIAKHFDMIAGTSTGGIIAMGLASGKTAKEIGAIYTKRGEYFFPKPNRLVG